MKEEIIKIIKEFMETQMVDGSIDEEKLADEIVRYIEFAFGLGE